MNRGPLLQKHRDPASRHPQGAWGGERVGQTGRGQVVGQDREADARQN